MQRSTDPYRVLFPLGCAFGIWGAAVWLAFALGRSAYPGTAHADLMIGGFLLTFSLGFLMTAIPKFTDTRSAGTGEKTAAVLIALFIASTQLGLWRESWRAPLSHLGVAAGLSLLFVFGGRRFFKRQSTPPKSFIFVAAGLLCGLIGASLLGLSAVIQGSTTLPLLGRALLYHGMMPCLVLGIGTRLLPALMGHASGPVNLNQSGVPMRTMATAVGIFLLTFPLELASLPMGRLLRAYVATFVAIRFWKLLQRPPRKGVQPMALWLCAWAFVLGLWGYGLFPAYAVHAVHLTFIGGLGLLTLLVATRVTLSHGGHGMALEQSSRVLVGTSVLALTAMLVRVFALWAGGGYFTVLAVAAALWIGAVLLWSALFVPKMVRVGSNS